MPNTYRSDSMLAALAVYAFKKITRPHARYKVLGRLNPLYTCWWA